MFWKSWSAPEHQQRRLFPNCNGMISYTSRPSVERSPLQLHKSQMNIEESSVRVEVERVRWLPVPQFPNQSGDLVRWKWIERWLTSTSRATPSLCWSKTTIFLKLTCHPPTQRHLVNQTLIVIERNNWVMPRAINLRLWNACEEKGVGTIKIFFILFWITNRF